MVRSRIATKGHTHNGQTHPQNCKSPVRHPSTERKALGEFLESGKDNFIQGNGIQGPAAYSAPSTLPNSLVPLPRRFQNFRPC